MVTCPVDMHTLLYSLWQCYKVKWDDGSTDHTNLKLSPWDMELIHPSTLSIAIHSCFPIKPLNYFTFQDDTVASNLLAAASKSHIRIHERDRILQGLASVAELDVACDFREPVNVKEVPSYNEVIPFPTDLSTIQERLMNGFYR